MDTKAVIARFESSDKPGADESSNIASVYDAGATRGHPHFAMEYVRAFQSPNSATNTSSRYEIGSSCSSKSARAFSTLTKRASSIGTSSRRTF